MEGEFYYFKTTKIRIYFDNLLGELPKKAVNLPLYG